MAADEIVGHNVLVLYVRHVPGPPLSAHVAELWYLSAAPPHAAERILPSGTLQLVVNLDEDELRIYDGPTLRRHAGAAVSGAYQASFGVDTREHASMVGVQFRPGGAWPFLGAPPGALTDMHADLADLWGRRAAELRERLCAAPDPRARFALLERALLDRLSAARPGHPLVPHAIAALEGGERRVADVAATLGISHRRLIDVFTAETGLAPKAFARITRFRRALSRAERERDPDWARLAAESGFCDQSHLIREFVALSGNPPTALIARSSREHVKLHHIAIAAPAAPDGARERDRQRARPRGALTR
ncbi:AraC family transcriptional regulator [Sorangium cellulosum]|uniref:AraC family transcriptional regulator n=1 Tax=Sorangium cellulosum TaxID=56 RepID=A0A150SZL8_SORCE|nr:AraC family transcriptional regulator [Sorangium cellulosum]KYF97637.1 AraC family transcriptional regulator [Sorangium cellulosum]